MSFTQRFAIGIAVIALAPMGYSLQQSSVTPPGCEAPAYFGICDPYVPGTMVLWDEKGMTVNDTWPGGPAEKAGVCPGDQIVAVDGVPVLGRTMEQMLKEIVSPSPSPIGLKVKRGGQEREFHFDRVRETTLARLSHEKFMFKRQPFNPMGQATVPLDETREEMEELSRFYAGIDRRVGFKLVDNIEVPEATPEAQVKNLERFLGRGAESQRVAAWSGFASGETFSAGFLAVLLKNPSEVLVSRVFPDSPAHRAGLFPGDQLLQVNGRVVAGITSQQLTDLLVKPDDKREVVLKVNRGQSVFDIRMETQRVDEFLGASFPYRPIPTQSLGPRKAADYILGIRVLYAEPPREAMVEDVSYPSPAFDAGVHFGDSILGVNGVGIEHISRDDLGTLLQPTGPTVVSLDVLRVGKKLQFRIKPETYSEAEGKLGRIITKMGAIPADCPGT